MHELAYDERAQQLKELDEAIHAWMAMLRDQASRPRIASIAALALFCRVWRPRDQVAPSGTGLPNHAPAAAGTAAAPASRRALVRAWMPWLFLSIAVILWGLPAMKAFLNGGPRGFAGYRAGERPSVNAVLAPSWQVPLLR